MTGRDHAHEASAAQSPPGQPGAPEREPEHSEASAQWVTDALGRHEQGLLHFVTRIVGDVEQARDVVQHAFLRLLGQTKDAIEPHLAEWLYTVCRNRALDLRRKDKRQKPLDDQTTDALTHNALGPADAAEQKDAAQRVMRLLGHLPKNQQEVLRLRFQSGLSYKEISGVTRLSVTNVGFLIHTGLATLREKMGTT